jgi:hypothetical protein
MGNATQQNGRRVKSEDNAGIAGNFRELRLRDKSAFRGGGGASGMEK